ncbi:MAG: ATP-binding domain-containing protein, partial [Phycisphaerales bacterium]|nr:ATP-binding domain-containing protein [Phycisphaerales bacterium]
LGRILNNPPRGIGDATRGRLEAHAAGKGLTLLEACSSVEACEDLGSRARGAVRKFASMVAEWQAFLDAGESTNLGELVSTVLRECGLEQIDALASEEERQRQANLAELVSAAGEFSPPSAVESSEGTCDLATALREYLESVALVSDADTIDPLRGAVTLMTLHAAKGLEFSMVSIIGVEDGLLPHSRSNESDAALEEERRLLFVGMTRAARRLALSWARVRTVRGMRQASMRSRFFSEIPASHVVGEIAGGEDDEFDDFTGSGIEYDDPSAFDGEGLAAQFAPGTMVRHAQFGTGVIESFTPRRGAHSVTVRFKALGRKTLVLEYARLQRVEF